MKTRFEFLRMTVKNGGFLMIPGLETHFLNKNSEEIARRINPLELFRGGGRTSSISGRLEFNQGQISRGMIGKIY